MGNPIGESGLRWSLGCARDIEIAFMLWTDESVGCGAGWFSI